MLASEIPVFAGSRRDAVNELAEALSKSRRDHE
jgi:hypothetical protein